MTQFVVSCMCCCLVVYQGPVHAPAVIIIITIIIFFGPSVLDSRRYKILSKVRLQRRSHFWVGKSDLKGDCISPLECYRKPLEQEHGLPGVFCDRADTSANLWDQVNRQPVHHAWNLKGDWKLLLLLLFFKPSVLNSRRWLKKMKKY